MTTSGLNKLAELPSHIYSMLSEKKQPLNLLLGDQINEAYRNLLSKERWKRPPKTLRCSEIGKPCPRQLWYSYYRPELAAPLTGQTYLKFAYGHILEALVLQLAQDAGYHVERQQERFTHVFDSGWTLTGSIDAVIEGVLVDVKSVTAMSVKKFDKGLVDDPFGYKAQLNSYSNMGDFDDSGFLTIEKELGKLAFYPMGRRRDLFVTDFERAVDAVSSNAPPPGLEAVPQSDTSPNMALCTTCSYCDYKKECWKDANDGKGIRTFMYSNKPVFLVKVVKEPKVDEV